MKDVDTRAADTAAVDNGWPLVRAERTWSVFSVFSTATATALATWCFIIGGFVSYYLAARPGTIAIIAGSLIGILFVALACVPVSNKYGFDAVTSTTPQFGTRGKYLAVALIYLATTGWNIYLIVLLGKSAVAIADNLGLHLASSWVGAIGIAASLLVVVILRNGADSVKDFTRLIAVVVVVLAAVIIVLIGVNTGWSTLFSLPPTSPNADSKANWASGLEVLISVNLSWWAYTGAIVRNRRSGRSSLWSTVFALGLGVGLGSLAGFYGGLAVPNSAGDPTLFIVAIGGAAFGIVAMGFIIISSFGTSTVGMYSATLALRQIPAIGRLGWRATTLLGARPHCSALCRCWYWSAPFTNRYSTTSACSWHSWPSRSRRCAASRSSTTSSCVVSATTCRRCTTRHPARPTISCGASTRWPSSLSVQASSSTSIYWTQ